MVGFWILFVCWFKGSLALEDISTKSDEPWQRLFHQTISDIWKRLYSFIHSFIHSQTFIEKQPGAGTAKIRGEMRDTLITNKFYLVRSYLQIYIYIYKTWNKKWTLCWKPQIHCCCWDQKRMRWFSDDKMRWFCEGSWIYIRSLRIIKIWFCRYRWEDLPHVKAQHKQQVKYHDGICGRWKGI